MRSVLKLIAFSLVLSGCVSQTEQPATNSAEADNPSEQNESQLIQPEPVDLESVRTEFAETIDCQDSFEVIEGDFQTIVCNQGVIRFWDQPLTDSELAPWSVWCEPSMAAGDQPSFEVLFSEQFIIENKNPETIGSSEATNLCQQLANRELAAFEPSFEDSYGLLTNMAQSGLCMGPPAISNTNPLRHVCSGFGLDGKEFTLWLETGEIETLVNEYAVECGAGISGTFGKNWLKSTYDLDVVVSGERLPVLLSISSPLPFSDLCDGEETG